MPADFGYINARIKGLKAKLLAPEFYSETLSASDYKSFLATLAQSPYMAEVEEASSRFEGLKIVDDALSRHFFNVARSMQGFADGRAGKMIRLMLMRYDLNNLKSIARGKHAGKSAEEITSKLIAAGELKPAILETIASASDMAGVAQAMALSSSPLKRAFSKAYAKYASDGELYGLELTLDKEYFRLIKEGLQEAKAPASFQRYIERQIDATNLRTALGARGTGGNPAVNSDELFVPGGKEISRSLFSGILGDGSSQALQPLSSTSFAAVATSQNLTEAEAAIRSNLDKLSKSMASDALGIGVATNYLSAKEAEIAKLRLLARGKYYGVSSDILSRELGNG